MTIERGENYDVVVECDRVGCDATFAIEASVGFERGWPEAKRQGWRAARIGRDWVHGCPRHAREI